MYKLVIHSIKEILITIYHIFEGNLISILYFINDIPTNHFNFKLFINYKNKINV